MGFVYAEISFRGAWIATVANIDWPSKEAVGNDSLQKAEMTWLLDSLQSLGLNAIIFQALALNEPVPSVCQLPLLNHKASDEYEPNSCQAVSADLSFTVSKLP